MLGCFLNQLAQREKEEDHILFLFFDRAQEEFLFPFALLVVPMQYCVHELANAMHGLFLAPETKSLIYSLVQIALLGTVMISKHLLQDRSHECKRGIVRTIDISIVCLLQERVQRDRLGAPVI